MSGPAAVTISVSNWNGRTPKNTIYFECRGRESSAPPGQYGVAMLIETLGKYVGGKVVTAACVVASAAAVIWFWRHPESAQQLWQIVKYGIAWIGFAAVLPWASYPLLPGVLKKESNAISAILLAGFLALDVLMALWLCGWHVGGALSWAVLLLGFIAAGAYNFVVCESLARQIES